MTVVCLILFLLGGMTGFSCRGWYDEKIKEYYDERNRRRKVEEDVADLKTAVGSLTTKIMRQEYEREVNG
jgi:hypothetical protein